jgi:hypothetical protein
MMPPVHINWLAVLAATAANMVIGGLWYGPILGKKWMKAMGMDPAMPMTPEKKKAGNKAMMMMVPLAFLSAWVMAYMVDYSSATTAVDGAITGFWLWLGFQVPIILQGRIFENKKWDLIFINGAYQLVALAVQGAILAAWA